MEHQDLTLDWDSKFLAPLNINKYNREPISPQSASIHKELPTLGGTSSNSDFNRMISPGATTKFQEKSYQLSPILNSFASPPLTLADLAFHGSPQAPMESVEPFAGNIYQGLDNDGNIQWSNYSMNQEMEQMEPLQHMQFSPLSNMRQIHRIQELRHTGSDASLNSWSSQASFNPQQWVHESQPSFQCSYPGCNKVFTKLTNLKSHSRIHNTDRMFSCKDCGASFRRSHDLKRHERSLHSDVKPYGCNRCGKRFSRMDALKRHTSRVTSACFSQPQ